MADLKRLAEDATTRAAIAAGKDAAKRALDDLILSDDEKAKRETEKTEVQKSRRWKYIGFGLLALCLLAGVLGLVMAVMSYWPYFLMAGVLGAAGVYGWWRFKKSRRAPKEAIASKEAPALQAKAKTEPVRVVEEPEVDLAAQRAVAAQEARERAEAQRERVEAQREARAEAERQIDDELAEMKARLKK